MSDQTGKTISLPVLGQVSGEPCSKGQGRHSALAAFAAAVSPLASLRGRLSPQELMQRHYKQLSDEDKDKIFARLEAEAKERYGADVKIRDPSRSPGSGTDTINLSVQW